MLGDPTRTCDAHDVSESVGENVRAPSTAVKDANKEAGNFQKRTILLSETMNTGTQSAAVIANATAVFARQAFGKAHQPPPGDHTSFGYGNRGPAPMLHVCSRCDGSECWEERKLVDRLQLAFHEPKKTTVQKKIGMGATGHLRKPGL